MRWRSPEVFAAVWEERQWAFAGIDRNLAVVCRAMRAGLPVEAPSGLMQAVMWGNWDICRALLATPHAIRSINGYTSHGETVTMEAAWKNTPADIMELITAAGGTWNMVGRDGSVLMHAVRTPIHRRHGDRAIDRLAHIFSVSPDLDLDVRDEGKTAEELARAMGYTQRADMIRDERVRRDRWSGLRRAWIKACVLLPSSS